MKRVLLVSSSDYLGHPFSQRHNQIFERLHDGEGFEVRVVRFRLFDGLELRTRMLVHELGDVCTRIEIKLERKLRREIMSGTYR